MTKIKYREISPELEKLASPRTIQNSRVSIGFESEVGEFYYLLIEDLIPYKNQARKIFDLEEIENLAETIRQHGIRQPLSVLKSSDIPNKYEVVSGERRLRAAKIAALEKVPCIIIKDENHADEIALIENIQRQDLHPIELARAINVLVIDKPHGAKAQLSRKIGLSKSQISDLLSLLSLPHQTQEKLLIENVRGREHFRKILLLPSIPEQLNYIDSLVRPERSLRKSGERKHISQSIIRLSMIDGILKVQNYALNKITNEERTEVKKVLLNIIDQLDKGNIRGRERFERS
jgi:ParB family chromosome partitioning protein